MIGQSMSDFFARKSERANLGMSLDRVGKASAGEAPPHTQDSLNFTLRETTRDDEISHAAMDRGQFLARQDMWDVLATEMAAADADRMKTPAGTSLAELLAFGARSDVVNGAEHALFDGHRSATAPLVDGINEMEGIRQEYPEHEILSIVVALTHIDLGWAWRSVAEHLGHEDAAMQHCMAHFDRASAILDAASEDLDDSTLLASARCSLYAGRAQRKHNIADDYAALIDLDPMNYRAMRAMGNHLLPRWLGSYGELELEARRTAARTEREWGAGAYTWVQFDAIVLDDVACALVDVDFFIDGLRDIVKRRPDQTMINLLAAYCSVALRCGGDSSLESREPRAKIAACAEWLIKDHMTELHPLIWAHACDQFDNAKRVTSVSRFAARGREIAMLTLQDLFNKDRAFGVEIGFVDEASANIPV